MGVSLNSLMIVLIPSVPIGVLLFWEIVLETIKIENIIAKHTTPTTTTIYIWYNLDTTPTMMVMVVMMILICGGGGGCRLRIVTIRGCR